TDGRGGLEQVVGDLRIDNGHPGDIEDEDLGLLLAYLREDRLHDLRRSEAVDGAHDGQEQDALVDADDGGGELANGGLVALDRVEVAGDVRVDRDRHVEE